MTAHLRPVDLAHEPPLAVGRLEIDPAHRRLSSASGAEATLEPRVMQVLVALAREPGQILSRDDLITTCWDGVVVGDDAINRVISQLRKRIAELGDTGVQVETVTKVGYSLVVDADAKPAPPDDYAVSSSRRGWLIGLALAVVALLAAIGAWRGGWIGGVAEARPVTMTILPVRAQDEGVEALGVGLRTRLVTMLNATGRIEVSGLESAALLDRRALPPLEIGRSLGKDHVTTLSIHGQGAMLEVALMQVATVDGSVVVDETFRRPTENIELLLHDLASAIARANPGEMTGSRDGREQALQPGDEAILLTTIGLLETGRYAETQRADTLLRELEARYPENARIKVHRARATATLFVLDPDQEGWSFGSREAVELAREARRLAPDDAEANVVEAFVRGGILSLRPAVEKAALLDLHNPAILDALSSVRQASLDFEGSAAASRARWELDPLFEAYANSPNSLASLGDVETADQMDEFVIAHHPDEEARLVARSRMAERRGDHSEAVRLRLEAMPAEPGRALANNRDMVFKLGLAVGVSPGPHGNLLRRTVMRLVDGDVPDSETLEQAGVWRQFPNSWILPRILLAKLVNYGRSEEVVAAYDRFYRSPTEMRRLLTEEHLGGLFKFVAISPDIALALRDAGRGKEAEALLALAAADVEQAVANGRLPSWYHVIVARLYAVRGDHDQALRHLQIAIERNWPYHNQNQFEDGADLDDDRALAPLADTRIGRAFDTQLNTWRDRERRQVEPMLRAYYASDPFFSGSTSPQSE